MTSFDVVVVGAGPAGMAAASAASRHGAGVCLIDDNATCGGQIWRGPDSHTHRHPASEQFAQLQFALQDSRVELRCGTSVVANPAPNLLTVENSAGFENIRYGRVIIATGARERFLPFPGWTMPGVMGIGGLQAMVKGGLNIAERRVVLAGSGPLLLAVAAALSRSGARIVGIFEQASITKLTRFCAQLLRHPRKLHEALSYRTASFPAPYRTGSWVVESNGDGTLRSVAVSINGSIHNYECDYLGCAFHLVPNLELPRLMNCEIQAGLVRVSETQETSVNGIYCAGEPAGIGGLEKALCEGEIAGLACADRSATHLYRKRDLYIRFARHLNRAFAAEVRVAEDRQVGNLHMQVRRRPARAVGTNAFISRSQTAHALWNGPLPGKNMRTGYRVSVRLGLSANPPADPPCTCLNSCKRSRARKPVIGISRPRMAQWMTVQLPAPVRSTA